MVYMRPEEVSEQTEHIDKYGNAAQGHSSVCPPRRCSMLTSSRPSPKAVVRATRMTVRPFGPQPSPSQAPTKTTPGHKTAPAAAA